MLRLFEPERIIVQEDADDVENPKDHSTERDPQDRDDQLKDVVGFDGFENTPDGPAPV